ncbi:acyltransferase family protein [Enterobacter asburiae]|uniref:acyltransferase family protein n=1 Tax=Enterobacter asburiae TaxID=61645 RepID=UPI0011D27DF0|nr:acyltransferase family protein [Enterobacter asburiae]
MLTKDKSITLDYAKALGIISVVIGHYNMTPFGIPQPYLFHMALFFFIGGMLLNPGKNFAQFLSAIFKKHILYIVVTYIVIGGITKIITSNTESTLYNPFPDSFYETIHSIYRSDFHINSLFLVAWFLLAYSIASVFSLIALKFAHDKKLSLLYIFLIAFLFGYLGMVTLPSMFQPGWNIQFNYLSQACSGSMFMLLGFLMREAVFKYQSIIALSLSLLAVSFMTNSSIAQPMTMSFSSYPSGYIVSTLTAMLCIYSVFCFASMMQKQFGESLFLRIGRSSKTIMSYHLLVLYMIDLFISLFGWVDIKEVNALTHYYSPYIWPVYLLAPVILLTGANATYKYAKEKLIDYALLNKNINNTN